MDERAAQRLADYLAGRIQTRSGRPPLDFSESPNGNPASSWVLTGCLAAPSVWRFLHSKCQGITSPWYNEACTARTDPSFYQTLYCYECRQRAPVEEFTWWGGSEYGEPVRP